MLVDSNGTLHCSENKTHRQRRCQKFTLGIMRLYIDQLCVDEERFKRALDRYGTFLATDAILSSMS